MEGEERLEESTIAAPNTAGHVETDQHWVCHQPQDGERAPMVVMVAEFELYGVGVERPKLGIVISFLQIEKVE